MEDSTAITVNHKDVVNIVCEIERVPSWIETLLVHGYEVTYIGHVNSPNIESDTAWNIIGNKEYMSTEEWLLT
jgi:hypothetical protein